MTERPYCLHPGIVRSRNDGQEWFIGADKLIALYGLRDEDCTTYSEYHGHRPDHGRTCLFPREDGLYLLPPTPR